MTTITKVILLLLFSFVSICATSSDHKKPRIGIIGAGLGGASAAYYIRELFGTEADIDVYESGAVGGRLATLEIGGRHYETGGTIIHPRNMYMVNLTKALGLRKLDPALGRLSIYDGNEMVFDGSSWTVVTILQLLWRYGKDIFNIKSYINNLMEDFARVYVYQDEGHAFTTVEDLLAAMSPEFPDKLKHTVAKEFSEHGFSERFIHELVLGAMRNNYGQSTSAQSFVGSVSMAGVEPGLWKIQGGNKQVPQKLLENAKVNLIRSKVTQVALTSSEGVTGYKVYCHAGHTKEYDIVILAAPHSDVQREIQFIDFPQSPIFSVPYHRTTATFVRGIPNYTAFGYSSLKSFPEEMMTCNVSLFFNSIGRQAPVDYDSDKWEDKQISPVWKVFSQEPLTPDQLDQLFLSHEDVHVVDWVGAYPHYPSAETSIPKFELHENLYYVNAIEMAAAAMEMSVIGSRNVALLAYNRNAGKADHIDSLSHTAKRSKTEL